MLLSVEYRISNNNNPIKLLTSSAGRRTSSKLFKQTTLNTKSNLESTLSGTIDNLGILSAKAQNLKQPITSVTRLAGTEHTLYLIHKDAISDHQFIEDEGNIVGLLKVGFKKLFLVDQTGRHLEISPLCVLDFYVMEEYQRIGYGKKLFEYMLEDQSTTPIRLAYDRPSQKLLKFLGRHYHLSNYLPQPNNYVVFGEYWFKQKQITNENSHSYHSSTQTSLSRPSSEPKLPTSSTLPSLPPLTSNSRKSIRTASSLETARNFASSASIHTNLNENLRFGNSRDQNDGQLNRRSSAALWYSHYHDQIPINKSHKISAHPLVYYKRQSSESCNRRTHESLHSSPNLKSQMDYANALKLQKTDSDNSLHLCQDGNVEDGTVAMVEPHRRNSQQTRSNGLGNTRVFLPPVKRSDSMVLSP
ncbi:touch receptor neuron protein Mec-17-domain-containing protein [Paraphysoderma sedebokerense]|nr:touch receptor neuron protein Mec-17-domain-containing protein [Paraphysoderma sedebokerense]